LFFVLTSIGGLEGLLVSFGFFGGGMAGAISYHRVHILAEKWNTYTINYALVE